MTQQSCRSGRPGLPSLISLRFLNGRKVTLDNNDTKWSTENIVIVHSSVKNKVVY